MPEAEKNWVGVVSPLLPLSRIPWPKAPREVLREAAGGAGERRFHEE